MKVVETFRVEYEVVEVKGAEWETYYRYSADNWSVGMGDSIEPIYSNHQELIEELETAYQKYITMSEPQT